MVATNKPGDGSDEQDYWSQAHVNALVVPARVSAVSEALASESVKSSPINLSLFYVLPMSTAPWVFLFPMRQAGSIEGSLWPRPTPSG